MIKVRRIFLIRKLAAPFVFLVAAAVVVGSTVSVSHVLANMPAALDIPAVMRFFAAAFAHADVIVKSALVAGTLFLLMILKGAIDSIRFVGSLQKA